MVEPPGEVKLRVSVSCAARVARNLLIARIFGIGVMEQWHSMPEAEREMV